MGKIFANSYNPTACMLSSFSCVQLFVTLWTPCSLPGSSVHGILQARILECFLCPPLGDLPNPGIEPASLMSPALAVGFFTTSATWEAHRPNQNNPTSQIHFPKL